MRLVELRLQDWRNVTQARIDTDARFVLGWRNAQGKTNILESAWVLATSGAWGGRVARLVRHGANSASVTGRSLVARVDDGWSGRGCHGRQSLALDEQGCDIGVVPGPTCRVLPGAHRGRAG